MHKIQVISNVRENRRICRIKSRRIFFRVRNFFRQSGIEIQNKNFTFSTFFPKIVGKHVRAEQATDDNIIGRTRFACWITKVKHTQTHTQNMQCFSTVTMVTRTPLNITFTRTLPDLFGFKCQSCNTDFSGKTCRGQITLWGTNAGH